MGAAYTSDLTEKWGSEWLSSQNGGPFWAQILRTVARKDESAGLSAKYSRSGESLMIEVTRRNERGESIEQVPWKLKATDEDGKDLEFELRQTGLGKYTGSIDTTGIKQMNIRVHDELAQLSKSLTWQRPYSAEYQLSSEVDSNITSLPIADSDSLYESNINTTVYKNASWLFVCLGFILSLGGLVVRRI